MAGTAKLGAKVRALRRQHELTQAKLAERLEISPSYLNLIEHNRRALTAPLLIKLANLFKLDITTFAADDDERLTSDLLEVFSDNLFEEHDLRGPDIRELVATSPTAARAIVGLYEAYRGAKNTARGLAARMSDDTELAGVDATHLPSEEVSQFIQRHWNHFSELEAAAENIRRAGQLGEAYSDAERLRHYLQTKLGVRVEVGDSEALGGAVRRFDKGASCLRLSHMLSPRSRRFQMAHVVGLITQENVIRSLAQDSRLSSDEARTLGRVALANYFAAALLMPYDTFLETAKAERYDLERLGHRFDSSYEQVCHRLTSLQRPGAKGVPFHMVRVDIAGNLSKRFSSSGIHFARFAGACPRWNIYHAFLTPGRVRTQISTMPDGTTYFCVARTIERGGAGYHAAHTMHAIGLGCKVEHASALVYADGIDLESKGIPVGVTCRTCERMNCVQRAMPPLQYPLAVDELVRGLSFYAPASAE